MRDEIFCVVIFIASLVAAILPMSFNNTKLIRKAYPYITAASAGLLFSILLLEFMPHCFETKVEDSIKCNTCFNFHKPGHDCHKKHNDEEGSTELKSCGSSCSANHKNLGLLSAGFAFLGLIAIDSLFLHHSHCPTEDHAQHHHDSIGTCNTSALKYKTSTAQAFIFILALSLHSFFEGMSIDKGNKGNNATQIGILIHKILESFALGVTMGTSQFSRLTIVLLMIFYSSLTPLGVFIAKMLSDFKEIGNGLALGSTMFIVCVEIIPSLLHSKQNKSQNSWIVGCLVGGFSITSLILWNMDKLKKKFV